MKYTLAFETRAISDVLNAMKWYESQRNGLGLAFLASLQAARVLLEGMPLAGTEVRIALRRLRLRQFPYSLYYRVVEQRIGVYAVLHDRRSPRVWRSR